MTDAPEQITIANLIMSENWDVVGAYSERVMSMGYVHNRKYIRKDLHDNAMLLHEASIAELEAEREALQAKLDMAMATLDDYGCDCFNDKACSMLGNQCGYEASATLAELKGTNHDT